MNKASWANDFITLRLQKQGIFILAFIFGSKSKTFFILGKVWTICLTFVAKLYFRSFESGNFSFKRFLFAPVNSFNECKGIFKKINVHKLYECWSNDALPNAGVQANRRTPEALNNPRNCPAAVSPETQS